MFKDFIFAVFHPTYWVMSTSYDRGFDQFLRELMNSNKFEPKSAHSVVLGPMELWVANHPYSSFVIYVNGRAFNYRASRRTIQLAQTTMLRDIYGTEEKK